ncbi:MAG: DNA-methyltransferase [Sediminispirochaetaceae bacterium]
MVEKGTAAANLALFLSPLYTLPIMVTRHCIYCADAKDLNTVANESVHLVVTSPPYPMIEMWDLDFSGMDHTIRQDLGKGDGRAAFEKMHLLLDLVWGECFRVLVPGGIVCINIGDATRSLDGRFRLYANHARVISVMESIGFQSLPHVLWRKQTNSPTKFMGSGMLPGGAYVTLEHEYVLIFRKGGKREFRSNEQKRLRRRSALFWEERNSWFSDVWEFKGTRQAINGKKVTGGRLRERSAAYPFELAYRLIHMYSLQGETVLDPFAGTGTTIRAAVAGGRNSIGYEISPDLTVYIRDFLPSELSAMNEYSRSRLDRHREFIAGRACKHRNNVYDFPVVTSQETELEIPLIGTIEAVEEGFVVTYRE